LAEELLWGEKEFCEALASATELYGQPLIRLGGCLTAFQQDLIFGTLQDFHRETSQRCIEVSVIFQILEILDSTQIFVGSQKLFHVFAPLMKIFTIFGLI
jgi:hypothetical protein